MAHMFPDMGVCLKSEAIQNKVYIGVLLGEIDGFPW